MNKKLKSLQNLVAVLLFISLSIGVQRSESAVSTCTLLCSGVITDNNEVITQLCLVTILFSANGARPKPEARASRLQFINRDGERTLQSECIVFFVYLNRNTKYKCS